VHASDEATDPCPRTLYNVLECVVNVSEGRDVSIIAAIGDACGPALLDVHADPDHHRSVYTLAGPGPRDAAPAARVLARAVAKRVDITQHDGVHPYLGALDVVPFVALSGTTNEHDLAVDAAQSFGRWWSSAYEVPVFFYGDADAKGRDLPQARRTAFSSRKPDLGPSEPHPIFGATAVGVRAPLIAVNCVLRTDAVDIARRIAREVRESSGGLPGVRALGFMLDTPGQAQVSMNLIDLERTGVERACRTVRVLARKERTDVTRVEVVGLMPRAEFERCTDEFLEWSGLDSECVIETRIGRTPQTLVPDAAALRNLRDKPDGDAPA
jgi:glutamate formiminotransferase